MTYAEEGVLVDLFRLEKVTNKMYYFQVLFIRVSRKDSVEFIGYSTNIDIKQIVFTDLLRVIVLNSESSIHYLVNLIL